ncbi:PREDICTED: calcium-dependent protein kinase SK5-like isoform X2 [Ipomoea nil]|uniref:calcium-dependent protein kinase SK5-like isoform X2 n=1 Tax=Ipomoea nil TaxID=35883 RepID=UPI000900C15C|nr:PREDICTED: calcium-dependent protein kinase SK5-like isoform X2 [Ipomoea nil]
MLQTLQFEVFPNSTLTWAGAVIHDGKRREFACGFEAFAYFDKDGSRYITIDELQQACKDFGSVDASLEETIKEIDKTMMGELTMENLQQ